MFKVLVPGCDPKRGSKFSACVDLFASEDCVIGAGETKIIGLGICIDEEKLYNLTNSYLQREPIIKDFDEFKDSHYLQLNPRSSLRTKGLISHTGIIDLDYPKEIKIIIHNPLTFKTAANIAIAWVNRLIMASAGGMPFPVLKIEKDGFDGSGGFIIKKEDKSDKIKASKIAQITLIEHKSYLIGVESEEERDGGFGSTGE